MKIIVMGTGPFAVPTIDHLRQSGHEIPCVVTRPLANPQAKKLPPRPVFDWATENGLPLYEPQDVNAADAIARIAAFEADLLFVCDYGQILSPDCLASTRLGGINLHGSILPRHRGAAPVQWALLRGDQESGVTVIHMTPGLDAGPALAIATTPIRPDENAAELEPRLAELGVGATDDALSVLSTWDGVSPIGELQDKSLITKAPRFAKRDGSLDFRHSADYLARLVRACQPWPGTFAELVWPDQSKRLRIIVRAARAQSAEAPDLQPGYVKSEDRAQLDPRALPPWDKVITAGTGQGALEIARLQPAGKREMNASEFLRGHPLLEGCHFALPEPPLMPLTE